MKSYIVIRSTGINDVPCGWTLWDKKNPLSKYDIETLNSVLDEGEELGYTLARRRCREDDLIPKGWEILKNHPCEEIAQVAPGGSTLSEALKYRMASEGFPSECSIAVVRKEKNSGKWQSFSGIGGHLKFVSKSTTDDMEDAKSLAIGSTISNFVKRRENVLASTPKEFLGCLASMIPKIFLIVCNEGEDLWAQEQKQIHFNETTK